MPKDKIKLRENLKGDLLTQINEIWQIGTRYQESQQGRNIKGPYHCETVENNLSKLIPEEKKKSGLCQMDLFLLSASACLHDIDKTVKDLDGCQRDLPEKNPKEIIYENCEYFGLRREQANAIGHIVDAHDGRGIESLLRCLHLSSKNIDIKGDAAIFHLADMLDSNYWKSNNDDFATNWQTPKAIIGWDLDEKNRIILKVVPDIEEIEDAYTFYETMKENLSKISPYLMLSGYPHELGALDVGDFFHFAKSEEGAFKDCPFPGMSFYTIGDADIFRGRDEEINELFANVNNYAISLLVGESGVGKTSLIHAGLFPRLEKLNWKFVFTRPFDDPIVNIKGAIQSEFLDDEVDSDLTLIEVMKKAAEKVEPQKLLIVIDRFEDILNCGNGDTTKKLILDLTAVQTQANSIHANLRVLISFCHDAEIRLKSKLLNKVSGSSQQFRRVDLERLKRDDAKLSFLTGIERGGFGLEIRKDPTQKELIDLILDDISGPDGTIFPPHLQILAEKICKRADPNSRQITRDLYLTELLGAEGIINGYLIDTLAEFGTKKEYAKKILISLTPLDSPSRMGDRKSLERLALDIGLGALELKEILKRMCDLGLIRLIENDEYEVINDYLTKIVKKELIEEENKRIKSLLGQLEGFYINYVLNNEPINLPTFLASLYRRRKEIDISKVLHPLILCTCMMGKSGFGWYWLKDIEPSKVEDMAILFLSHDHEKIRTRASEVISDITRKKELDKFVEMLLDKRWSRREAARESLTRVVKPEDRDKFIGMLTDKNEYVRRTALEVLAKIGRPKDVKMTIEMLEDNEWSVREAAVKCLISIGRANDVDKLIKMLDDNDWKVREAAREGLERIVRPDDRGRFIEMLIDTDWNVRRVGVEALAEIGRPEDADKIIEMLYDIDINVRLAAVEGLARIGRPEDVDRIVEMIRDKDCNIRITARESLVEVVRPEDADKLVKMIDDGNSGVQRAAVESLAKVMGEKDREALLDMLSEKAEMCSEEGLEMCEFLAELDYAWFCPGYP